AAQAIPTLEKALTDMTTPIVRLSVGISYGPTVNNVPFNIREMAAISLGTLGPLAKSAAPALMICLDDKDPDVRGAACEALGKIGSDKPVAIIGALTKSLLNDKAFTVRRRAAV